MDAMPKSRLPHLLHERNRHGKWVWYFRRGKGPRTALKGEFMSPEFVESYHRALKIEAKERPSSETLAWLIGEYQASPGWQTLASETRRQLKYQFKRIKEKAGQEPFVAVTAADIVQSRDARAAKPSDANKFLKASKKLFAFAVERGLMKANPAAGIAKLQLPNRGTGFPAWVEDEVAAYERRWPIGTRERLALDLILYTGGRRGDIVRLGRQHEHKGALRFKTMKSVNMGHPVDVEIPILPPLAKSIAATETGDLSYLKTARGGPFSKGGFGTWFKKACRAAGIEDKSSHGARKIAAIRCAENGATEAELNAIFGWADGSRESATYIRNANRAKIARAAADRLISPNLSETPRTGTKNL